MFSFPTETEIGNQRNFSNSIRSLIPPETGKTSKKLAGKGLIPRPLGRSMFLFLTHNCLPTWAGLRRGSSFKQLKTQLNPFIFALITILLSSWLSAGTTGSLEGTVWDKKTGEPLFGVNIILSKTQQGAATNQQGFFKIHNIRAGIYEVRVSMIGYCTMTFKNIVIHPDRRSKLDVELEESPIEMEAIVVTTERPVVQTDVTGTSYHIDSRQIIELPIDKFSEAISLQAGTTLEGNIRGGKVREVIYLIDGLPVNDVIQGGLGTNLPKSSIFQMNIQTGGFDAEYGDALSGIVNVITRNGSDDNEYYFQFEKDNAFGGTEISKRNVLEFALSGPIRRGKLHYFIAGNGVLTDTRWWQDMQHFFDSPVEKEINGFGKMDWLVSPSKRLGVQMIFSSKRWRDYEFSWRYNLEGLPPRLRDSYRTALVWTHNLSKKTFYTINMSHYYLHSKIGKNSADDMELSTYDYDFYLLYVTSGNRNWWANMNQNVYSLKTEVTSQIHTAHLFKAGFEFKQYDIKSKIIKLEPQRTYFGKPLVYEPLLNYSNQYHYYPRSGSFYIQDKIEAGKDKSVLSIGCRVDFLDPRANRPAVELVPQGDQYQEEVSEFVPASIKMDVSPRLGYSFPITDKSFFFVNYGHYVQYPLFEYLYSGLDNVSISQGVQVLRGNPDLLAEKTKAWEISARYNFVENMVISIAYFNKETEDQIDTKTFVPSHSHIAGDYGFAGYVNNPYAFCSGFEFVLSRDKGDWVRGHISYTYMNAKGLSNYVDQGLNYAQWGFEIVSSPFYLSWDQRHTAKADVVVELPLGIQTNIIWQYHSGKPYTYYPSKDGFNADNPEQTFLPNNRRMPKNNFLHIRVNKTFRFGPGNNANNVPKYRLDVYLDARNLFDEQNVRWMDSTGRIGGELADPAAYYVGRRMSIGIKAEF